MSSLQELQELPFTLPDNGEAAPDHSTDAVTTMKGFVSYL